jgi:tetratricopeptide (TPR) repeat protein
MKATVTEALMEKQLEEQMKHGIAASESGDKAAAEGIFRDIVGRNPNALEAWVWLGWTSMNADDAEAAFARASEIDPTNEEAKLGLRWVASQREAQGAGVVSETPTDEAFAEAPVPSLSHSTAPSLEEGPQTTAHMSTGPVAVEAEPIAVAGGESTSSEPTMHAAIAAAQAGDKEGAHAMFLEMAERNPGSVETWVWVGGTSTDLDEAESAFLRAVELDPEHDGANLGLRWVALRRRVLAEMGTGSAVKPTVKTSVVAGTPKVEESKKELSFFPKLLKRFGLVGLLLIVAAVVVWGVLLAWLIMVFL